MNVTTYDAAPYVDTAKLYAALVAAQAQLVNPPKTKTAKVGAYSYTYADLPTIIDAVRPVLHEHGLAFTQSVSAMDGMVGVKTILVHSSGEAIESSVLWLPAGDTPQQAGSAITYARRYSLCAVLGIAADEDDDAPVPAPKRRAGKPAAEAKGNGEGSRTTAAGTTSGDERGEASPSRGVPATAAPDISGQEAGPDTFDPPGSPVSPASPCLHLSGVYLDREASRERKAPVHRCNDCHEEVPA